MSQPKVTDVQFLMLPFSPCLSRKCGSTFLFKIVEEDRLKRLEHQHQDLDQAKFT